MQVGAVLLFAILIVTFATYQAFIVPDQNREVEFNHYQGVQRDMVEVRNTILDTYTGGNDGYAEVALGTRFPARLVSINPPPPSGSLRTTEPRPIVISEQGGPEITDEVCPGTDFDTRFLEYEPNYAEFEQAGTIRYESSLLYNDFRDGTVQLAGQSVVEGDQVQIIPITNDINTAGTQTAPVEPKAGRLDTSQREDITVKLPTQLSEDQWEAALDGEVAPGNIVVNNRNVTLTLDGERTINCGPVGIGETPPSGARGGSADGINPASPGDIRLSDETRNGDNVTLEFNNTAGTNNITEARINFYDGQGGNDPSSATIRRVGEADSATLTVGGQFESLSPKIRLDGDGTVTNVELEFDRNVGQNDFFVLTLELETGETALYFIGF
ncbi:hypothetical protein [Haloarcula rubra]|nr:hypothetical protein [Halomicroarcula rubra]